MMFVDNDDGGATLENNNKRQVASFQNDLYVCVFVSSRYYNESSKARAKRGHHSYDARLRSIRLAMATKQTTLLSFYMFSFSLRACITHINTRRYTYVGSPFLSYDAIHSLKCANVIK